MEAHYACLYIHPEHLLQSMDIFIFDINLRPFRNLYFLTRLRIFHFLLRRDKQLILGTSSVTITMPFHPFGNI